MTKNGVFRLFTKSSSLARKFKMFKNEYKWEEIIKKISCPILLITADKGLTSDKLAQKVMDVSKAGKWVKIEGAGHSIRREQFKQYVQITKEFLD